VTDIAVLTAPRPAPGRTAGTAPRTSCPALHQPHPPHRRLHAPWPARGRRPGSGVGPRHQRGHRLSPAGRPARHSMSRHAPAALYRCAVHRARWRGVLM